MQNLEEKAYVLAKLLATQTLFEEKNYRTKTVISEMPNVAAFQEQGHGYCKLTKQQLVTELACEKNNIWNYLSNQDNRKVLSMKLLYDSNDKMQLSKQISMLAFYTMYKDLVSVDNIPDEIQKRALDMELVSKAICLYTYFALLANESINANDYDELFIEAWYNYYGSWIARQMMLKMRGNDWINDFDGAFRI